MSRTALWVLLVFGALYAAFAIPLMRQFRAYCSRVAHATHRPAENAEPAHDDVGNNRFQLERLEKLSQGDYGDLQGHPGLIDEGRVLSSRLRRSKLFAIALVVLTVVADYWAE